MYRWKWENSNAKLPECDRRAINELYGPVPRWYQQPENYIVVSFLVGMVLFVVLYKCLSVTEVIPKTKGWKSIKTISKMRQSIKQRNFPINQVPAKHSRFVPPIIPVNKPVRNDRVINSPQNTPFSQSRPLIVRPLIVAPTVPVNKPVRKARGINSPQNTPFSPPRPLTPPKPGSRLNNIVLGKIDENESVGNPGSIFGVQLKPVIKR